MRWGSRTVLGIAAVLALACGKKEESAGPIWVDALVAKDLSKQTGRELQVHGFVRPGSIHREIVEQTAVTTFVLERNGKQLSAVVHGPLPDVMKDNAEVLAIGKLSVVGPTTQLEARELQAGCLPPNIVEQLEAQPGGPPAQPPWCAR